MKNLSEKVKVNKPMFFALIIYLLTYCSVGLSFCVTDTLAITIFQRLFSSSPPGNANTNTIRR